MSKVLSAKERRKLKKLKRNVAEALLLSGCDPTAVNETTVTSLRNPPDNDISRKLQTMRHLKNPPQIHLNLNRLYGARIGSRSIAELVHYVTFRNVDKPIWISLRPNRGILQTVVFRVNCSLETVESNKKGTFIGELFGPQCFIRMQSNVNDATEFWTSLLNVSLSKFERLKRILSQPDVLKGHIKSDLKGELLVTLRQMVDFCYPFPGTSDECAENTALPPIVPTKEKYGPIKADSPFFAIDCEMCATETGESELTRISIVDENYEVLLDTLVKPKNKIIDYVTKYSGITEEMLENVDVRLEDVQKALSHILPNDAILVGHTLECDFHALRITHPYCVDISLCLNLSGKDRQRSSLKTLARIFLDEEIQGENGHCSVDDAVVTMRLLNYKLSHGIRFGNVSLGWSYDDWARENGLTSSGARIKRNDENSSSEADIREPEAKRRCLDTETVVRNCDRCGRPLSVACIVANCACRRNTVKNCVMCCLDSVPSHSSSEEPTLIWRDAFETCCVGGFEPILHHLRRTKDKTALYVIPGGIGNDSCNESEVYIKSDEYNSLDDLTDRISAEVISHSVVMMNIDTANLKMRENEKPLTAVDNALRKLISYASWNSLIIVVLSSAQESVCYVTVKTQNRHSSLKRAESM